MLRPDGVLDQEGYDFRRSSNPKAAQALFVGCFSRLHLHWVLASVPAKRSHAASNRHALQSRIGLFHLVREITRKAGHPGDEALVYVCGEPAVVFHLRASGLPLVSPVADLGFLGKPQPRPTFVVMTSRAARSEEINSAWWEHGSAADLLKLPEVFESDLVRLDEAVNFDDLDNLADKPTEFWWWYVRSKAAASGIRR